MKLLFLVITDTTMRVYRIESDESEDMMNQRRKRRRRRSKRSRSRRGDAGDTIQYRNTTGLSCTQQFPMGVSRGVRGGVPKPAPYDSLRCG